MYQPLHEKIEGTELVYQQRTCIQIGGVEEKQELEEIKNAGVESEGDRTQYGRGTWVGKTSNRYSGASGVNLSPFNTWGG